MVLATDTINTVALFLYDEINQGSRAQVGLNAGDGVSSYMLPEALSSQTVDLDQLTNAGEPGIFVFRVDGMYFCCFSMASRILVSFSF